MVVTHVTRSASDDPSAPPATDLCLPYFAGRDPGTGNVFLVHIHADRDAKLELLSLTAEHIALFSARCCVTGVTGRDDFFVHLPQTAVVNPHASLAISTFRFQGMFGHTVDEAVEKLVNLLSTATYVSLPS